MVLSAGKLWQQRMYSRLDKGDDSNVTERFAKKSTRKKLDKTNKQRSRVTVPLHLRAMKYASSVMTGEAFHAEPTTLQPLALKTTTVSQS